MRFEANLIHPDDAPLQADGELELPDDLVQLGNRLRDEASHLAACYPAGVFGQAIRPLATESVTAADRQVELVNSRTSRKPEATHVTLRGRKLLAATLASALVVAVVTSAVLWRITSQIQPIDAALISENSAPRAVSEKPAAAAPAIAVTRSDVKHSFEPTTLDVPSAANDRPDDLYILEASGPELEGLLDLWEQDSPQRTKISI